MTIKQVLAEMTDAELRTKVEELFLESLDGYSKDELREECLRLAREGTAGYEEMTREELEKDYLDSVGREVLEDPEDEAQVAEELAVWLQEERAGQ